KSCKKILKAKYWLGLSKYKPIELKNIYEDLNNVSAKIIQEELIEKSITLVSNKDSLIPLKNLDTLKIASIILGSNSITTFENRLKYYDKVDVFFYKKETTFEEENKLLEKLKNYNIIIIGIHGMSRNSATNFNVSNKYTDLIEKLSKQHKVILDIFGNPYSLLNFTEPTNISAIIVSYNDWTITNDFSAQLIFGGIPALGNLPVNVCDCFQFGTSIETMKIRLKYTKIPETVGVNSTILIKIDSIVDYAIKNEVCPGGQIVAAKDGVIFYQNSFGKFTYKKDSKKTEDFDLYDLASVTKVLATTFAMQKLYDEKKYSFNENLSRYLIDLKGTNKENLTFKDILTHSGGLKSWINFYKESISSENYKNWYSDKKSEKFPFQVAENMFITKNVKDSIFKQILESDLGTYGKYLYSDLGFYLLRYYVEKTTSEQFDIYLEKNFYKPTGAWATCFNPLQKFDKNNIAPTEIDTTYRKQTIQGFVHDQGAAMLGGISGHAGLFSDANDIAKLLQIMLNEGEYGGKRYFSKEVTKLFTKYQFDPKKNKRGLAWEKNSPDGIGSGSKTSSYKAFGHNGFTGPLIWADPEYNFSFVFVCNRTYPNAENKKILTSNIRTNIEEILYQSFINR
ncbi:MAG: serine hydrolase, partial [Bacteroidales bacterium]|nr:serine hydrolase [Bacteroidales bacterium]